MLTGCSGVRVYLLALWVKKEAIVCIQLSRAKRDRSTGVRARTRSRGCCCTRDAIECRTTWPVPAIFFPSRAPVNSEGARYLHTYSTCLPARGSFEKQSNDPWNRATLSIRAFPSDQPSLRLARQVLSQIV